MRAYTLRLDDEKADMLKHVSIEEGVNIRIILTELIYNYLQAHRETIEILSKSGWMRSIEKAKTDNAGGNLIKHAEVKKILNVGD